MKNRKYKFEYILSYLYQFMIVDRFSKFKFCNIFKIDIGVWFLVKLNIIYIFIFVFYV